MKALMLSLASPIIFMPFIKIWRADGLKVVLLQSSWHTHWYLDFSVKVGLNFFWGVEFGTNGDKEACVNRDRWCENQH